MTSRAKKRRRRAATALPNGKRDGRWTIAEPETGATKHQIHGRRALDFDIDFGGKSVLERNCGVGRGMARQLYSALAVAQLAGDARHAGGRAAVLRPGKPFEPDARRLTVAH